MIRVFHKLLKKFWYERQRLSKATFDRTLPFADYVMDRWERAEVLGFGEGSSVYDNCLVLGNVRVGEYTWIGPNTLLDGSGELIIGSHCCISAGVQIYSHDSVKHCLSSKQEPIERQKTVIGNNCYIAPNVIISKGVTIGNSVVIGANSLVMSDIPDNYKAFGTPCRLIEKIK